MLEVLEVLLDKLLHCVRKVSMWRMVVSESYGLISGRMGGFQVIYQAKA